MTLSKEVPQLIARYVKPFVDKMLIKSGLNPETQMIYAIHPGGPKIIDEMKVCLNLEQEMVKHSCEVLKNHGNMSSATLPHVWEKILQDDTISDGTPIVSLAFGPGLTIAGSVFQKCSS
jgi:predicted naringenin-chalcone synthase